LQFTEWESTARTTRTVNPSVSCDQAEPGGTDTDTTDLQVPSKPWCCVVWGTPADRIAARRLAVAVCLRNRSELAAAVPLNRMGRPNEIPAAALFLACGDSSFVAGAGLSVDGGMAQI
jgi:NAD(P)-dependent dehydrogenase (short-subunit alcohol dehydrogenase family)